MEQHLYKVITTGEIKEGHDPGNVQKHIIKLFNIDASKAAAMTQRKSVVKKGLNHKRAFSYKKKLESIGLVVRLKRYAPGATVPKQELQALSLTPVETESSGKFTLADTEMVCPKCKLRQITAKQCRSCGLVVDKFHDHETNDGLSRSAPNFSTASGLGRTHRRGSAVKSSSGEFKVPAFIMGAFVAFLGALLWQFIATSFDYELGIVAWGIGGAIGLAAAAMGSRGDTMGFACGVFALLAIAGGKYLTFTSLQADLSDMLANSADQYVYMALYEEEKRIAKVYVSKQFSDDELRQFIWDNGYTNEVRPASITGAELRQFKQQSEPLLRKLAAGALDYESWLMLHQQSLKDISIIDLLRQSMGLIDILFLFLGIVTAFKLGRGRELI